MNQNKFILGGTVLALGTLLSSSIYANTDPIRIGVLATLEGPFAQSGQDAMRGAELALKVHGGKINGRDVELIKESSNAKPDVAVARTRKLIELDNVDIVVGPLSGSEGLAVKEYARSVPGKTFVNGTSGAADTTLRDAAPNFFRFTMDGTQWQAGLGSYAYDEKGYRKIAVVSEDYSFPYAQVMGFQSEFCPRGGEVVQKAWVPIGTKDYSSVIARLPSDVDAIYVLLGGADAVNFLTQYYQTGGEAAMIGGTVTIDQNVLSTDGVFTKNIVGMIAAGPTADTNPSEEWQAFVEQYKTTFPDGFNMPSSFAHGYYLNTMAVLQALDQVEGKLDDDQKTLQQALASLKLNSPTGVVTLDENRQAIANNFVTEVVMDENGRLQNKMVHTVENVNQTLGMERDAFLAIGAPTRNNPACQS